MAEESRSEGNIPVSLYVKYLQAGAHTVFIVFVLVINVLAQVQFYFTSYIFVQITI